MNAESESLTITILKGSGSGDLKNIPGDLKINQEEDNHYYELNYDL